MIHKGTHIQKSDKVWRQGALFNTRQSLCLGQRIELESLQRDYSALMEVSGPSYCWRKGIHEGQGTREAIAIVTLLHFSPCRISVSVIAILFQQSWLNHILVYCTFQFSSIFSVVRLACYKQTYTHSRLNIFCDKNSVFSNFSISPA